MSGAATVTLAELLLPASAQKELRRSQRGFQSGDFRKAAKHLENAIQIYPKLAAAHHDLGVCHLRLREYEKAIAEFQEASESDTHLSEPVISLAAVFYRLGRYPEGEAAARRALALDPVNPRIRYLLGAILAKEGRDDSEAIELLRDSRRDFPAARLHLVSVLLRDHATDEAVAELREYLQQPEAPEKDMVACIIERLRQASTCALSGAQSEHEAVPFELRNGFMITVQGSIGGLKNLCFALDTGATQTMLSREIAEKLSLPRQRGKVLNFDRDVEVEWAETAELQIGPLMARNVHVMVSDLKQFTEFADGIDGIIGLDLLRMSRRMRIDYKSNLIVFQFDDKSGAVALQQPQAFLVRLPVQGQTMTLVIDTGLEGMLLYEDRLRIHLPNLKLSDVTSKAHTGRLSGEKATLTGIQIDRKDAQATVMLIPSAPKSLPSELDGYLGITVLKAQMVELNFRGSTLSWQ